MSQTPPAAAPEGNPAQRFFGALFMAVGGLIAGLSGLCSAGVLLIGFASGSDFAETMSVLPIVLFVGGIPIAVGLALFFLGRWMYRQGKPKPDPRTFD
jgi:hypothetical protein